MYTSLMPDLLSINADLSRAIDLAARHGFAGADTSGSLLAAPKIDLGTVKRRFEETGIRPGYVSLSPGRVPVPEPDWQTALAELPLVARRAQTLEFRRAALVVLPFHETLAFEAAFEEHRGRINAVTRILDDFGIALALEYVAPLSRRAAYANHFVHDMRGMLALCDTLNSPRVGLLLDSFHWHCAGETTADIARLSADKIVVVHINDAPNRPIDLQTVGDRALPGATGVIDLAGFVGALRLIGYDGPITCEPMAKALRELPTINEDKILALTAKALRETVSR